MHLRAPPGGGLQRLQLAPRCAVCSRPNQLRLIVARAKQDAAWKLDLAELNKAIAENHIEGPEQEEPVSFHLEDKERVFLVGVQSLQELARLADTAGLVVVGETYQMLDEPNSRSYIGSGKVAEIVAAVRALGADTVIFDDELSPRQQRNIEKALRDGVRVADRTALILDIFEQRAGTREGKLQVEMAATEYQLPRLKRMWTHLERQSGSGMTRSGMGETQMEIDKRLLRDKMAALRKELESVRFQRKAYRKRRKAASMPVVALVGYTNAGKSTLINRLTHADVLAEDKLFATLDPTTRRMTLPSGKQSLISDTVGFIQKLPTQLVAAFRATLEEIEEADVLLHVVDVSHVDAGKQSEAVLQVLEDIGVSEDIPMVTVWNKLDACADPARVLAVAESRPNTVAVSAMEGYGIEDLVVTIEAAMEECMSPFEALIPYSEAGLVNLVRETGIVRNEEYREDGVALSASANLTTIGKIKEHILEFVPQSRIFSWREEQVLRELRQEMDEEDAAVSDSYSDEDATAHYTGDVGEL